MPKHPSEFDDHLFDFTREPDTELGAKMPPHRSELHEAFFELALDVVTDFRDVVVLEGWTGRREHSPDPQDGQSLNWVLPERHEASEPPLDPFSDRWSALDDARMRDAPEAEHELDFDR
ncbi:hypothetical protein [Caulobacter sp. DWP3-1-3b2]|uniref:hypothetical protein n=1 Tax=Caulobacter sp. DWP3-1-3b2 TaxID=2804643 RepID=UPI003CE7B5BD